MATLDATYMEHLARLARLALSPEQQERVAGQMARIVEYVGVLRQVSQPHEEVGLGPCDSRLAEDHVDGAPAAENHLRNAVRLERGHLVVPLVIDHQDQGKKSP